VELALADHGPDFFILGTGRQFSSQPGRFAGADGVGWGHDRASFKKRVQGFQGSRGRVTVDQGSYQAGSLFFGEFSSYPVNSQTELKGFLPNPQFFLVLEHFP
jgi:hypothetical protein